MRVCIIYTLHKFIRNEEIHEMKGLPKDGLNTIDPSDETGLAVLGPFFGLKALREGPDF